MRFLYTIALSFLVSFIMPSSVLLAQTVDPNAIDGQIHLKLSGASPINLDGYTGGNVTIDLLFAASGLDSIYRPFPMPGTALDSIYRVIFPNVAQVDVLISALSALPYVEYAEKNPLMFTSHTPNDLQSGQWALTKIQAEEAWNFTTGSSSVLVAVLDNAISIDHQDLSANIYLNTAEQNGLTLLDDDGNGRADDLHGYDVANNDADPRPPANASGNNDEFIHGTHVAGIVGAVSNNNTGIASIGYSIKILPVKIGRDSDAALTGGIDGIYYAMRSGADVISMSWGTTTDAATLKTVVQQAAVSGALLVAAAGNDGDQTLSYPAAYPQVVSVGATDENDAKASFSSYGSTVDVMAPGVGIYSTLPENNNTYGNLSGTSMATPLVSGLAGLVKSYFPNMNASQIRQRIEQGCEDISAENPGMSGMIGAGRINAFRTLGNVAVADISKEDISMWPNPCSDVLYLKKPAQLAVKNVTVVDVSGREVLRSAWSRNLDLNALSSGVYSLNVATENHLYQTKFIVQ